MNQDAETDKRKKKLKIYYALLITVVCLLGVTYAWFRLYLSQSENNTIATRTCFSTSLTEDTSKIVLTDAFPISDEDGLKGTPFTFTLKNNCDTYVNAYITIDSTYRTSTSSSYLKDDYLKVNVSPKGTTDNLSVILANQSLTDLENGRNGYVIIETILDANEELSYDLRIWMDSEVTVSQGLDKTWAGKIVVKSQADNAKAPDNWYTAPKGTMIASLRGMNRIVTSISTPGLEVSAYKESDITSSSNTSVDSEYANYYITYGTGWEANGTKFNLTGVGVTSSTYANSYKSLVGKYIVSAFLADAGSETANTMVNTKNLDKVYYVISATAEDFSFKEIASNKKRTEAILASTADDYGTSYYYRGAVKNNYVQFANKCWRIVRVAGDGTIKLVLHNNNSSGASNPCSADNNDYTAALIGTSAFNEKYNDNAYVGLMYGAAGASDYESAHAKTNTSVILSTLGSWYTRYLRAHDSKIANTVWCNDKSVVTDSKYYDEEIKVAELGYGNNTTYYGFTQRIYSSDWNIGGSGPSLKCSNELSKVSGKIGLLSADEVVFAGSLIGMSIPTIYLNENAYASWYTSTPYMYTENFASVWNFTEEYGLQIDRVDNTQFIRPSISLVSTVKVTGAGTSEDPFIIN